MNAVVTREFLHHMHLAHHSTESIYVNIEYAGNIYIQYLSLSKRNHSRNIFNVNHFLEKK